ncbi:MAG: site-specific integrase [Lachnospiraceae bacterium]|nr:site-specific integrase [Lachnospiraceae bacterium]
MKRKDNNGIVLRKGETQLESGRYRYRYTDNIGKQHDVYSWRLRPGDKAPDGTCCEESLREKEAAINEGLTEGLEPWKTSTTLNELVEDHLAKNKDGWAHSTYNTYMASYNKYIKPQLGRKKVTKITTENVYEFYNLIYNNDKEPKELTTMKPINLLVTSAMQTAVEQGMIRSNPAQGVIGKLKRKKTDGSKTENEDEAVRALEDDQLRKLLDFMKKYYSYLYYYPLFYLMAWTGCRIGEVLALTWYDIDFRKEILYIRRSLSYQKHEEDGQRKFSLEPPKTEAGCREIPMLAGVKDLLLEMKRQSPNSKIISFGRECSLSVDDPTPFVLHNRDEKLIHYNCPERKLHAIIDDYNARHEEPLPQITSHVFRHTFTCWLCENADKGTPMETLKYIQSILGHSDADVTLNVYMECRRKKRSENHEMLRKIAADYY